MNDLGFPARGLLALSLLGLSLLLPGCGESDEVIVQRGVLQTDAPRMREMIREDLSRGRRGVRIAAHRLRRGFLVEDPERREREIRQVMLQFREPRHSIEELLVSPISFIAAVGTDGKVICRNSAAERDRMRGFDLGQHAPPVRAALQEGTTSYSLVELPNTEEGQPPSVTVLFAAPARVHGRIVGAVATGIPLWRISQQVSRQLQLEAGTGTALWGVVYRGETRYPHSNVPESLLELMPADADRRAGLSRSPGGYTTTAMQFGQTYGIGVHPLERLGEGVGIVLFRGPSPH